MRGRIRIMLRLSLLVWSPCGGSSLDFLVVGADDCTKCSCIAAISLMRELVPSRCGTGRNIQPGKSLRRLED
jgi:hypothetical protein